MISRSAWLFLALGVAGLSGLFVLLEPGGTTPASVPAAGAATAAATPAAAAAGPRAFDLVVRNGRLVSGPARIQVTQGEEVRLTLESDRADELHLHGYDLHLALPAHEAASLTFEADRSGRFDFELHEANIELGALEVLPR